MNKVCLACLILALLFSRDSASAANLVTFPTGPAAWTIDVTPSPTNHDPAAARQVHTLKIEVAQDGQKRRTIISYANGTEKERWELPSQNIVLAEDSRGQTFGAFAGATSEKIQVLTIPFTDASFQWLAPEFLREKDPVEYQGKMCFHYKGSAEAWIDSKTLLPVALDNGTDLGVFTFSKDPPPPLVLPAKFQITFDRFEAGMGVLNPVPSK